jgi:hypothetical protein
MTRIDAHGMISRKRFPDTGGWGFAQFNYDAASDTFTPDGSDANCGYACHTTVAAKDYIFTAQTGTMSAFGTGRKRQVRLTKDQQSVDNTARGDGNAEGRQR